MRGFRHFFGFLFCVLIVGTIFGVFASHDGERYSIYRQKPVVAAVFTGSLINSTLAGGTNHDYVTDMAVGPDGSIYLCGETYSSVFPTTPGAYDSTFDTNNQREGFVCRLSADCATMIYATYLGGSWRDSAEGIAVDADGCAYICGITDSSTIPFPTTPGAYDTSYAGNTWDAFVCKLSADGTKLLNSTFLGGTAAEMAEDIVIDSSDQPIVIGYSSSSSSFPTSGGAYDGSFNGGSIYGDIFVTKFNPTLSALVFSTWIGGTDEDIGNGVQLDPEGNVLVTGTTKSSTDFPTTTGAYDTSLNGDYDAFLCKLSADGTKLLNSTFLGGSTYDTGKSIAVTPAGDVYLAGFTDSTNFDTTTGAFNEYWNGGTYDSFVAKFAPDLATLTFSTLIGGSGSEQAYGIDVDAAGCAWVCGTTSSSNFNVTARPYNSSYIGGTDGFLTQLTPDGTALNYSSYFGGRYADQCWAIDASDPYFVIVGGYAWGYCFPTTPGAYNETTNGYEDAFCSKLAIFDTDGEGLGDWLELNRYGSDPTKQDTDDDLLDDYEEIVIYGTTVTQRDTEGDQMPDGWEVAHDLDPLTDDADEDPDGDGLTNLEEYLGNTDPHEDDNPSGGPDGTNPGGIDGFPLLPMVGLGCITVLVAYRKVKGSR